MADFTAKIQAMIDLTKVNQSISQLENKAINLKNVKISKFILDTSKLPSTLQAQLDSHTFTIKIGAISTVDISGKMSSAGSSAGQSFSQAYINKINSAISTGGIDAAVAKVKAKFEKLGTMNIDTSYVHTSMEEIENEITALDSAMQRLNKAGTTEELVSAWEEVNNILSRVNNQMTIVANTGTKMASSLQVNNLSNQMETWLSKNTKSSNTFRASVQQLNNQLKEMASTTGVTESELKTMSNEFTNLKTSCIAAGQGGKSLADSFNGAFSSLSRYVSASMLIYTSIRAIRESINTVVELNDALVDLQKTTTASYSQLQEFYYEANDVAKEYGSTTQEIIQSAADWSRQGYDINDSELMAQYSSMFASISPGMDIDTATTGLVSVMKAYGIEAEDVLDGVMSKINAVGNSAATTNEEIIEGLENSAAALSMTGSTLEENIALFTAAEEITQDSSKVGNALRSIAMRIRGYDEETEELSDDLVNISGEVVDLTKTASNNYQGISLFTDETQTEYKSIYTYLQEISEIWDELDAKTQQDLMQKLFGKNRASIGAAILKNFSAAEKAMDTMANSAGSAENEMGIITESLTYKLNALKQTAVGISQNLFQTDFVGNVITVLTKLLEVIDNITEHIGLLGTAFAGISAAVFIKSFVTQFKLVSQDAEIAIAGVNKLSATFKAMGNSAKTSFSSFASSIGMTTASLAGVTIAIAAVVAALAAFTYSQQKYSRAVEAASSAADEYSDAKTELESLTSEYEEQTDRITELQALKTDGSITLAEEEELETLLSQNSALEAQLAVQQALTAEKQATAAATAQEAASTEKSYLEAMQDEYGKVKGWFVGLSGYLFSDNEQGITAAAAYNQGDTTEVGQVKSNLEQLQKYKDQLEEVNEELAKDPTNEALKAQQESLQDSITSTSQSLSDSADVLQDWIDQCTDENGQITKGLEKDVKDWKDALNQIAKMDMGDLEKEMYDINAFFDGSNTSNFISDYLKDIAENGEVTEDSLASLGLTLDDIGSDVSIETLSRYFEELTESAEEADEAVSGVAGTVDSVAAAFDTDNQNADWESMSDYLSKASDLYENYQVGVDEFWEAAQFMTKDQIDTSGYTFASDAYVEAWENAIDTVNRYFDSDNPLESASNFQEDLISAGLGVVKKDNLGEYIEWSDEFTSSADAADALNLSLSATEVLMKNLEAYGAEFENIEWTGENIDDFQSALENIESLYSSMEDGATKDRFAGLIDDWNNELDGFEDNLDDATQDKVIHLEFEYDLASIQAKIDEINSLITGGDASVTNYASLIAGNTSYIKTAEAGLGFDVEGFTVPVNYEANQKSLNDLQNQLKNATSDEDKIDIQAKIANLQEIQKSILNAFSDSDLGMNINADSSLEEVEAAWNDFCSKPTTLYVDAELSDKEITDQLDQLAEGSTIVFNGEVDGLSESIEASLDTDGNIVYKADLDDDGVMEEIQKAEDSDNTITFKADTTEVDDAVDDISALDLIDLYADMCVEDDDVTPYVTKLNQLQLDDKFVELDADDQASATIAAVNLLETNDKFMTLTADDQATTMVNLVNALSLDDKWATLSVDDKATAAINLFDSLSVDDKTATISESGAEDTTNLANAAAKAIAAIPNSSPKINTTSNTASVVASSRSSLNALDGKTVNTYIRTHQSTVTDLSGTAHARGTLRGRAFAGGKSGEMVDQSWIKPEWRTKDSENALVGEEGQELVATKDGYWYTIGDDGAEFVSIPKGSVVFDANQTRRLLSNGFIDERGKTLLSGTAFTSGSRRLSSVTTKTSSSSSSSSSSSKSSSSSSSSKSSSSSSSSTTSSDEDDFEETLDWIEIKLDRLERAISSLDLTVSSTYKTWSNRNTALASEISKVADEIDVQQEAYERYMKEAESVGLSSSYATMVQNGTIDIETITDEDLKNKVDEYQKW